MKKNAFQPPKSKKLGAITGKGHRNQMADGRCVPNLDNQPNLFTFNTLFVMKKVQLTIEEWQRLAAITPEEKQKAFKKLARWMHAEIIHRGYDPHSGPFSFDNMGGDTLDVLAEECFEALLCGEWHWHPTWSLSSQLIEICKSKLRHIIRDYKHYDNLTMMSTGNDDYREQFDRSVAAQLQREANLRDMGYDMARNAVKNYPKLVAYIDALYLSNDYAAIAKRLGISKPKVKQLEEQLLELLENM